MKKMISLFKRNFENRECPAYNEYEDGTDWVVRGEGLATQKLDGTACLIKDGVLYKRLRTKKHVPEDFLHWSFGSNQRSGHGWVPVKDTPENHIHLSIDIMGLSDGTYELIGERINKNPENIQGHKLIKHGEYYFDDVPVEFEALKQWLKERDIEGIVWHGENDMVKIKKSDFGLKR